MYESLVDGTFQFLIRTVRRNIDNPAFAKAAYLLDEDNPSRDMARYGIYIFYINALKTLVLLLIALVSGMLQQVILFALPYAALRLFSFGVHLKTPLACTVLGLVYYLGGTALAMYIDIPLSLHIAICCICFICFLFYAPAETKKRPIPQRQRKPFKIKALTVLSVLMALAAYLSASGYPVCRNLILIATVCQTVNILPLTYKIIKE